jgi:2,3-bisphosphoglycerate-independent phosphoglycerate mutase
MDGWGVNPRSEGNATAIASLPNLKKLGETCPVTTLSASGNAVGLPEGQMGNSEVGHLTIGAGRVIFQELTRINRAIGDGAFRENPALKSTLAELRNSGGALHLLGLVSDGGVHSHIRHLYALLDTAKESGVPVHIHGFLDGRDTPPQSAVNYIRELSDYMEKNSVGDISTLAGRYYAMDRDRRWERVKRAYDAIVVGKGRKARSALSAVEEAYKRGETDEFVEPSIIKSEGRHPAKISDGDSVIFFNFRSDRARELTRAFIEEGFTGFERGKRPRLKSFVTMTQYDAAFDVLCIFPPQTLKNILAEVLSGRGIRQLRVAETEKYAHVTFFFNGGVEAPFCGEERILVPSLRDVATYDEKPWMRAPEIAEEAAGKIRTRAFGFILVNFANGDMVGHTGVLDAAVKGCEAVDGAVGRVASCALENGYAVIVTSDHGNCEQMLDYSTDKPHTAHTLNPVPFILAGGKGAKLKEGGGLKDVAPTILKIMGLPAPDDMKGGALF